MNNTIIDKPLDIIIVNFNSTNYVLACIGSIYASLKHSQIIDVNIIVVDNYSDDNPSRIKLFYPDIIYRANAKNIGFARAINAEIKKTKSAFIVLLNPDTIIQNGFFDKSILFMKENKDIGILGPKILEKDDKIQGSARSFPTFLTSFFGRKSPLSRIFPNNRITLSNILTLRHDGYSSLSVDWVSGACMVVRKDAIDQVGLLDERFFLYWEDADWCKRMNLSNWKVVYFPKASIYHHTGKSSETKTLFSIIHFHKSCYKLFMKYSKSEIKVFSSIIAFGLFFRCLLAVLFNKIGTKILRD